MASSPEFHLLLDLGLTIVAALGFSFLFSKMKLPVVIGQLVAGIIIGPFGLGLIEDLGTINLLASLGIILLLFTVGLDLDPLEIKKLGPALMLVTLVEVGVTFLSVSLVAMLVGLSYLEAVFAGAVVSITSTAILGKLLIETKALSSKASHLVLTVSVMEDIASILLLILLPGLVVASNQVSPVELVLFVLKGLLLLGLIVGFGWKIAPPIIDKISQREDDYRETTFLLALSFGFAFALLSTYLGYSPAIGAFLVGLMIRGKQAKFIMGKVGPVKDLFIVLFFVSMGTLINIGAFLTLTLPLVAILGTAMLGKFFGSWLGAKMSVAKDEATKVGVSMLPQGEFAFIIAREGTVLGVAGQLLFPIAGLSTLLGSILASLGLRHFKVKQANPLAVRKKVSVPRRTRVKH